EFRQRVAKVADEALLGRGAWLWLVRPDGWEKELAEVAATALAAQSEAEDRRHARDTERQLNDARTALARVEAELALLRRRNEELDEQATPEQLARRRAQGDAAARTRELSSVQDELTALRASNDDLRAQLAELASQVELAADREEAALGERDAALE